MISTKESKDDQKRQYYDYNGEVSPVKLCPWDLQGIEMNKKKTANSIIKKLILGGIVVLLPLGIMLFIAKWLFQLVTNIIQPLTNILVRSNGLPEIAGDLLVLLLMLLLCFLIGWLITTGAGRWFHSRFDRIVAQVAPGYRIISEIVNQFLGDDNQSPFSNGEVALVQIFGSDNPILVTAIVTSRSDEFATVMFPTCPNPSSGLGYHVPWSLIQLRPDVPLDSAVRTIIACGAGSAQLFDWPLRHCDPVT